MKGCEACAKVRELTTGAPAHQHVCKVVDFHHSPRALEVAST